MDPNACFQIVDDPETALEIRATAALDLLVWLARGGASPTRQGAGAVAVCEAVLNAVLDAAADDAYG